MTILLSKTTKITQMHGNPELTRVFVLGRIILCDSLQISQYIIQKLQISIAE